MEEFIGEQQRRRAQLPADVVRRMCRAYGTRIDAMLGGRDTGELIGGRICEAELEWLRDQEWARSADDVLWRRTKLGLHLDEAAQARVRAWFGG